MDVSFLFNKLENGGWYFFFRIVDYPSRPPLYKVSILMTRLGYTVTVLSDGSGSRSFLRRFHSPTTSVVGVGNSVCHESSGIPQSVHSLSFSTVTSYVRGHPLRES